MPGLGQRGCYLASFLAFFGLAFLAGECGAGGVLSIRRSTSSSLGTGWPFGFASLMAGGV